MGRRRNRREPGSSKTADEYSPVRPRHHCSLPHSQENLYYVEGPDDGSARHVKLVEEPNSTHRGNLAPSRTGRHLLKSNATNDYASSPSTTGLHSYLPTRPSSVQRLDVVRSSRSSDIQRLGNEDESPRRRTVSHARNKWSSSAASTRHTGSTEFWTGCLRAPPQVDSPLHSESSTPPSLSRSPRKTRERDYLQIETLDSEEEEDADEEEEASRKVVRPSQQQVATLSVSRTRKLPPYGRFRKRNVAPIGHAIPSEDVEDKREYGYSSPNASRHSLSAAANGSPSRISVTESSGSPALSAKSQTRTETRKASPARHGQSVAHDAWDGSRPPVSMQRANIPQRRRRRNSLQGTEETAARQPSRSISVRRSASSSRTSGNLLGSMFAPAHKPRQNVEKPVKMVDCIICLSEYPSAKAPKLQCGHRMCHSCLKRSFRLSVKDPAHMPPRCCDSEHIPLKHVDKLFDTAFKREWNDKFHEYSTRNRIYCPSKKCGEWIRPSHIRRENGRKVARCGRCKTKVCGICNEKWHSSTECPKDEETNQFLAQAEDEGWKRCYRCKIMVEHKEGCNHMTCRCGAEFCMICGTKWKGCNCPWFNYGPGDVQHGFGEHAIPVPHVRGNLDDIFIAGGPPVATELRRHMSYPGQRAHGSDMPRTYGEELRRRQMQEQADLTIARRMQLYDELGAEPPRSRHAAVAEDIFGVGNASGHHMNDHYRRIGSHRPRPRPTSVLHSPPAATGGFMATELHGGREAREGTVVGRLAERLSAHRARGVHGPVALGSPAFASERVEFSSPIHAIGSPAHRPLESLHAPTDCGDYEAESEIYAPVGSRHRRREQETRSSSLAGLTGHGRGMSRVFEWRRFVEPGVPEEPAPGRLH